MTKGVLQLVKNNNKPMKALKTLVGSSEQSLYELSKEQELAIEIGRAEISEGKYFENDSVISEMKKWLVEV